VDSTQPESLAERVRRLRIAKGLSQEALARLVGVSKTQVYLVERGTTRRPQPEALNRYANALGVTVDYLLTGQTAPTDTEGAWPPIEAYLRHTSNLSEAEIAQVARIIRALEMEQRRELLEAEQAAERDEGES